ncbi:hypothetical protein [Streptomyces sp. NPDC001508]|uniref:hypothetical protein n=1 Tax=Streptomyces sp. NPDC001508 TaxID=3154656 RepID=UPI00332E1BC8
MSRAATPRRSRSPRTDRYGSGRSLVAGEDGMTYLTVHRRRPGMRILGPAAPGTAPPS